MICCFCDFITEGAELWTKTTGENCNQAYELTGMVDIEIQPMGEADIALVDGGTFLNVFKAYGSLGQGIRDTNRLVIRSGCYCGVYTVSHVQNWCNTCPECCNPDECGIAHQKIILRKNNCTPNITDTW